MPFPDNGRDKTSFSSKSPVTSTSKKSTANTLSDKNIRVLSPSRKIATAAVLTSLALVLSYVESLVPLFPSIPGIKLGLANLVIICALYVLGPRYALLINLCRILTAGLLFSGVFGMIYSLAGGLLSLGGMCLLKRTGKFSPIGISVAGAALHNTGQLITARFIIGSSAVFAYFPVLIFAAVISGIIIGILAHIILSKHKAFNAA